MVAAHPERAAMRQSQTALAVIIIVHYNLPKVGVKVL